MQKSYANMCFFTRFSSKRVGSQDAVTRSSVFASDKRRQKFRVESAAFSIVVVRRRRAIFADKLFLETGVQ
jgi:hypothetical protein